MSGNRVSYPYSPTYNLVLHVSGSAYKIVNARAYHHGTMLITTRLTELSDILRPNKVKPLFHLFLRNKQGGECLHAV